MKIKARKTYRLVVGILFPLIYYFSPNKIIVEMFIAYLLGIMTTIEVVRKIAPVFWSTMAKHSKGILKEEPGRITGTTAYLLSCFIIIAIFEKYIAITAILFLLFGDTSSTIVGIRFGRIKFFGGKKSLEGSLAFLITCLLIGYLLRFLFPELDFIMILCGSIGATIIEAIPLPIDDNFTVGIGSAIILWVSSLF